MSLTDLTPIIGTNFVIDVHGLDKFPLLSVSMAPLEGQLISQMAVMGTMRGRRIMVEKQKLSEITIGRVWKAGDLTLWDWHKACFTDKKFGSAAKDGAIKAYDTEGNQVAEFSFKGAWPKSYKFPDLDAKGGSFVVEEVGLSVREWTRTS